MKRYLLLLMIPLMACLAACSDDDKPEPEMLFSIESASDSQGYMMKRDSPDPAHFPEYYQLMVQEDKALEITLKREDSSNPVKFTYIWNRYEIKDGNTGLEAYASEDKITLKFSPITSNNGYNSYNFSVLDKDNEQLGTNFTVYRCSAEVIEDLNK